ncbi:MAG: iron-containing alcohol dehydrogenase [Proteobacteria bacterium]|nr:iron-containing alcohol dehydrogenase [Pseudomonadota bacterium]
MRFEFATAARIIFGRGAVREVAPITAQMGRRAFVVAGRSTDRIKPLLEMLVEQGIEYTTFSIPFEPTTSAVTECVRNAREAGCDVVIGIGGGSVLDTGKVIAALLTNSGELWDYLEVIGQAKPLIREPLPYIAIPTTAGTGAEVTHNSVIGSPEHRVKVSMRNPMMVPRLAVVDPLLTISTPPAVTAVTGLDALTQLIEAFVTNKANPMTDGICREGLKRAARSLIRVFQDGGDKDAREDMSIASLFSGLALANAKLGAVHGFAGPMGGMFSAPHGAICARLLPPVIETNVSALKARAPDSPALTRYDEVAKILTGKISAKATDGVAWVKDLSASFEVPSLNELGITEDDFPDVVAKSQKASSMKGNPIPLTEDELAGILKKSIAAT